MRDIDPNASEYITSGYLKYSRPGGRLYDPITATIATIGGGLIGSKMSSDAAGNAAGAQVQSADRSAALQKQMFDEQNALQKPFRDNGLAGQNRLMDVLGLSGRTGAAGYGSMNKQFGAADFNADPGYQWRAEQGMKGLERSAAARGGLLSGGAMKDAMNYNQGAASQEYGNAYNRFQTDRSNVLNPLQSLSGMGQTATGQMAQNAGNYGSNVGNTMTQAGNAQASGYVGQANAWNNGISQGINGMQNYNMMNKLFPTGGYSGATGYTRGADPLGDMIASKGW